jgi:hypothetical protein
LSNNPFVDFYEIYGPHTKEEGPVRFAQEVLGITLDPWQEKTLRAYGRGERGISIRACHNPGKTFITAVIICYALCCRFPQNTVATAPSKGQMEGALVKEVMILFRKLPAAIQELYEVKKNRIELIAAPEESWFEARTAREEKPEALQGVHCDAGWVTLIADEASGVPEKIFESAGGSMAGHRATTILLSNPVRSTGYFRDTHFALADRWFRIHITGEKGTNGEYSSRVSPEYVEDMARTYGRESNAYRIRVLGEFPKTDDDTVIPFEYVESARERDIVIPPSANEIWGLDVAYKGDDETALVRRNRLGVSSDIRTRSGLDTMETAGWVKRIWDETDEKLRPSQILVDSIGYGAGVANRLLELGLPAIEVNVSESASNKEQYPLLRDELWFLCREWLASRNRSLPRRCTCPMCGGDTKRDHAEMLAQELVAPKWKPTSDNRNKVEPKDYTKKNLKRSPNIADALCLTFASEPATLIHGSGSERGWATSWNEPLSRNIAIV